MRSGALWAWLLLACGSPSVATAPVESPAPSPAPAPAPEPAPAPPRARVTLHARYALEHSGEITARGTWVSGDEILRIGAEGLEPAPESARIARALAEVGDVPEVRLHEGHRWALSTGSFQGARTLRVDARRTTEVRTPDLVLGVAPLDDGREVWIVARPPRGVQRIAILDATGALAYAPMPPRAGPDVPGLSELAAPHCAEPSATRVAGDGARVVVLVTECHVDAPVRLVRFASGGAPPEVRTLPPLGFPPEVMALLPDGRVAIAGATPFRVAIESPDGTWSTRDGAVSAVTIPAIAIGADGAVWVLALGTGPDGHDRWTLERDGALVDLPDADGVAQRPVALGRHPELGIVVVTYPATGYAPGARHWLLSER